MLLGYMLKGLRRIEENERSCCLSNDVDIFFGVV